MAAWTILLGISVLLGAVLYASVENPLAKVETGAWFIRIIAAALWLFVAIQTLQTSNPAYRAAAMLVLIILTFAGIAYATEYGSDYIG